MIVTLLPEHSLIANTQLNFFINSCSWDNILVVTETETETVFAAVDELQLALVTSTKASARLVNVDVSAALAMPGVVGFLDHSSVPGSNFVGDSQVEEIFATSEVCILHAGFCFKKVRIL